MNKLIKSLIYDMQVSLSVLDTKDMVNAAIKTHSLNDKQSKCLGELLTAAAYMSGCLKSEQGAISITIKSEQGTTISVSGDFDGHIRGYIDGDGSLKGGTLTVIKEDGFFRPFVGSSSLISDDVSQNLMYYFDKSEQIPTAVAIGVELKNGVCTAAGGVIMQLLPNTSDENRDRAEECMQNFVAVTKVLKDRGADGIMEMFFKDETDKFGKYTYFPEYKCNCSRAKISNVLKPLGEEELMNIISEQGKISVHCHYCNSDYIFTKEDVVELLGGNK